MDTSTKLREIKALVKAFGKASADLQQARYDSHNMIGVCRITAATIEYTRTHNNLIAYMLEHP